MKTLEELAKIRDEALAKAQNGKRTEEATFVMTIGMATCGITAGARPVFTALLECMSADDEDRLKILQTGCFGKCSEEPMVKLETPEGQCYYYGKLTPERAAYIYNQHIRNGEVVDEYLVEMEQFHEIRS